jgi:hypothetical protein
MNTPYTPTAKAIENATKTIGTVSEFIGVTKNNKRTFVMSFVSVRMGMQRVMDYTFTNNTGRLVYMKEVEHTYIG